MNPANSSPEGWTRVYYAEFQASPNSASPWSPNDTTQKCALSGFTTPNYVLGGDGEFGGTQPQPFTITGTFNFEANVPHSEVDFDAEFIRNNEWELPSESNDDSLEITVDSSNAYGPDVPGSASPSETVCGATGAQISLDTETTPVSRGMSPPANVTVQVTTDNTAPDEWWAFDNTAVWVH
jgi:hypothetical protein